MTDYNTSQFESDAERIERENEDNQRVNDLFNRFWVKCYLEYYDKEDEKKDDDKNGIIDFIKTFEEFITIDENEAGRDIQYSRFVLARNKAHASLNSVKNHLYLVCSKNKHPEDFQKVMELFKQRYPKFYYFMSYNFCDLIVEPRVCPAFKRYCRFENKNGCPLLESVKRKMQDGVCTENEFESCCLKTKGKK